jgi:hypothetical protein
MTKLLVAFESETLGRKITLQDLDQLTADQLDGLAMEAGIRLQEVKAVIRASLNAAHTPELAAEIQQHGLERGRLAMLLQQCQTKASRARKADAQAQIKAERQQVIRHSLSHPNTQQEVASYFQAAARHSLDPATYQRILLIAEQRRAANFARRAGIAYHPGDTMAETV